MTRAPATRARSAQDSLAGLDEHAAGTTARVRSRIPPESLRVIDETVRTGWIPFEHDKWIPGATIDELGEDEAVRYWRSFLAGHMQTPLLRTVLDGAIRLFGVSPGSFVRVVPRGWSLIFRDHCQPKVEARGDDTARVVLHDVAPEVLAWDPYPISFRAFFLGMIDLVNARGEVDMTIDADERRLIYRMRWH